jgi:uncharacterized membrane protein YkoI
LSQRKVAWLGWAENKLVVGRTKPTIASVPQASPSAHQEQSPTIQRLDVYLTIVCFLAVGLTGMVVGCASTKSAHTAKEERVTVAQLSAPARAAVEKLTAGGAVDQIDKEIERGEVVYDVEATVRGQHVEYLIADSNGEVLGTETPIDFGALPEPVRAAAEKYFGRSAGLKAMKGLEYGETHFEIEGVKNGKTVEVTFNPEGRKAK